MAIAPMLKTTIIGYRPMMDGLIEALQRAGVLDIAETELDLPTEELAPEDERRLEVQERLAEALFVMEFLARFHESTAPLSMFVSEKVHISAERLYSLEYEAWAKGLYRECEHIADRLAHAEREIARLSTLAADLEPWKDLRLQISQWEGTERTVLFTGTVPAVRSEEIRQRLRDEVAEVTVEELWPVGDRVAWVVIALDEVADDVRNVLAGAGFEPVSFPGLSDYPAEEAELARERIAALEAERERLQERARELARAHYHEAVALVRALESDRDALSVRRHIAGTERAFVITGWVEARHKQRVLDALEHLGDTVDVSFEEPGEDDEPPVALVNPWYLRPFELLTDLYGRPRYGGIDPTPLIAPFFLLFFAICIGDVGYGLMLVLAAWLIKTRLDVSQGVKRFMDLLMMGGAASSVVGVALGSYLALPADALPAALLALKVLDPVEDIQTFLLVALVIGLVQVFFGVLVAAYSALKRGDAASAVFDQLSIIFLFVMLGVAAVSGAAGAPGALRAALVIGLVGAMVMQGRAIQAALRSEGQASWDRLVGLVWVAAFLGGFAWFALTGQRGALAVSLLVSGAGLVVSRSVRRGIVAVLTGAYNVYGLTGFVGDVLSYLRLPALGLSGTLVGSVFNILARLVWSGALPLFERGGAAFLGGAVIAVLAAAVFAVGHVFNVTINLLGAFVHPARLQFVEFFSKFYEAGGRPFAPFAFRTEGLVVDAGSAGKEGGRAS